MTAGPVSPGLLRYLCAWWLPFVSLVGTRIVSTTLLFLSVIVSRTVSLTPGSPASVKVHVAVAPATPLRRPLPALMNVSNVALGGAGLGIAGSSLQYALVSSSRWKRFPPSQLHSNVFGRSFWSQCNSKPWVTRVPIGGCPAAVVVVNTLPPPVMRPF